MRDQDTVGYFLTLSCGYSGNRIQFQWDITTIFLSVSQGVRATLKLSILFRLAMWGEKLLALAAMYGHIEAHQTVITEAGL